VDYESVASMTRIIGLLFFVAMFIGVVVYAFWPGNKKQFEEDAKIPLRQDPDQDTKED
jgi:cytochrome c oxidase cbb3-type subunit 4